MNIRVFRDRCCGCGDCAATAPDVFGQDDDEGRVVLLTGKATSGQAEDVRRAAEECPTAAIELV